MYKVVVAYLYHDEPGVCYTGFETKESVIEFLKQHNIHDDPYRWIIFRQEIEGV